MMIFWLLHHLPFLGELPLGAAEKITFRAALAAMLSFLLAVILGPRCIGWLARRFREPNKSASPELERLHANKHATPTMGGLFIVAAMVAAVLLLGDLTNRYLLLALGVGLGMAAIGAVDDLVKLRSSARGLSVRSKLAGQFLVATAAAVFLYFDHARLADGLVLPPPLPQTGFTLGLGFIPLAVLVIVGSSNAVNLTDGLDGLAGGCLLWAIGAMSAVVYASGHAEWAAYLGLPRIAGSGELTVLAAGLIGGVGGFLWFNCHPAQVFMGDTGSLALGGLLGLLAVVVRQELFLVLVGGVFVIEAASVILQVGSFKLRGKRVFRCAPLHHHFQLQGWPENKIVVRFWIAAAFCALAGLATLKLNVQEDHHQAPAAFLAVDPPLRR